jgi:hypothetical protein
VVVQEYCLRAGCPADVALDDSCRDASHEHSCHATCSI